MRAWRYVLGVSAGVLVMLAGTVYFLFFVTIPYQDPPPELRAQQGQHAEVASALWFSGLGVVLVTMLVGCVRLVHSLFARRNRLH